MSFTINRREEEAMIAAYTPDKVRKVMTEAAKAGGMGPPSLGPGDRRIPWSDREVAMNAILQDYAEKSADG